MRKPIVVIGAGGFGREVAWLIADLNKRTPLWDFLGFLDDKSVGNTVEGYPIIGNINSLYKMNPQPSAVIAIADAKIRLKLSSDLRREGVNLATLIHPSVVMSDYVTIGSGSVICAGTIMTTNIHLGISCIVNLGCFMGHDTVLGDCVSMMPATNLAGEVNVGTGSYFGLNACVTNRTSVGEWCIIGAGAAVVDDIPPYSLAVGVPAKVIKTT